MKKERLRLKVLRQLLRGLPPTLRDRLSIHLGKPDVYWSLSSLRRLGFLPRFSMDVGAYVGDWTRVCLNVFPETIITCVEPQDALQADLKKLTARHANVRAIKTLLGRQTREGVPFADKGPGSSVLLPSPEGSKSSMTTIDDLIDSGLCEAPELLKLDAQGYEMEILKGYAHHFDACKVIQCELSLLPLVPGAPLLHHMVAYLRERGFVMFDIDELIHGPHDGAVWQIDAIFCQVDSPQRSQRFWGSPGPHL
jgi:FkbM family methyltransferase